MAMAVSSRPDIKVPDESPDISSGDTLPYNQWKYICIRRIHRLLCTAISMNQKA